MGRPEFEMVVAQAPREYMTKTVQTYSTELLAGGSESLTIYAPAGFVAEIISVRIDIPAPAAATTGYQYCYISYGGLGNSAVDVLYGAANYPDMLEMRFNMWEKASKSANPPDAISQISNLKNLKFDDSTFLAINYKNSSDKSITGTRYLYVVYMLKQIAKG